MCGVAVALGSRASDQVNSMLSAMAHRGVRQRIDYGIDWAIGHRRLPIVGTGEGNDQPVQRGSWTIAFVGEVLDFRERSPGLECDLDLVADTWRKSGPGGFTDFDGFWSVVARNSQSGEIHLLVDYLSQKPLYVRDDAVAIAAASEPDAVASLGPLPLDQTYLSACIKWGYCPETWRTPYQGVRRILPGEHAVMDIWGWVGGRVRYEVVDTLVPASVTPNDLKRLIEKAVRRRVLSSDVPVACLMSGGLDSAITYTLARRYGDVRAYHVENGEGDACRLVAPGAILLGLEGVSIGEGLDYMQEPMDLGSLLPQVALSDAVGAARGERVCLTGDGADEFFGGYGRSLRYDSQASDVWHELVAWHLPRLDRVMMRNCIEVRSPFLARRVASAALGLPRLLRTNKRVLRDLFRGNLPTGVADLTKRPLRTGTVEVDRELNTLRLLKEFITRYERRGLCPH